MNKSKIIDHMATCVFYTLHTQNIPSEILDVSGQKIKNFEFNMHKFICKVADNPLPYLTQVYQNYTTVNKRIFTWEKYIELFLLEFVRPEILKMFKRNNYIALFSRIFSDAMNAYIIELKKMSPNMFLADSVHTYQQQCVTILAEKLSHYTGIAIHSAIDPSIDTVPFAMYQEMENNYDMLYKKYTKLKNKLKDYERNKE
jgi:hypothetical protein